MGSCSAPHFITPFHYSRPGPQRHGNHKYRLRLQSCVPGKASCAAGGTCPHFIVSSAAFFVFFPHCLLQQFCIFLWAFAKELTAPHVGEHPFRHRWKKFLQQCRTSLRIRLPGATPELHRRRGTSQLTGDPIGIDIPAGCPAGLDCDPG